MQVCYMDYSVYNGHLMNEGLTINNPYIVISV